MKNLLTLLKSTENYALLEDSKSSPETSRNLLFTQAQHEIIATTLDELPSALEKVEAYKQQGLFLCGYLSYEAGYHFIDKSIQTSHTTKLQQPLLYFIVFEKMQELNRKEIEDAFSSTDLFPESKLCLHDLKLNATKEIYLKSISTIKKYIESGDTYQINYTIKYLFKLQGNLPALYQQLRRNQPVEFGALLNFPQSKIVSLSPELFIKKKDNTITSKPMKGTAKRGLDKAQDDEILKFLKNDPKTLSENVMIVDLIRNDFGRVCETGSVHVNKLFEIQTFKTIHQMISTVKGTLKKDLSFYEILKALFPCGSITGAPKIRTMEIINDLEKEPRGIYTGAIGYLLPDNDFYFNVPIRTVSIGEDQQCEMGIGSGIIYESDAKDEYAECLLKADFLTSINKSFYLIEAFRFDADKQKINNIQRHLSRLGKSANYFGFKLNLIEINIELEKIKHSMDSGMHKIRLCAYQNGDFKLTHEEIFDDDNTMKTLIISDKKIDSTSIFQYHKTSRRELYTDGIKQAKRDGHYEIIFLNERNEVAEASYHNIFIRKGDQLFTPPLSAGILDGIYRQQFIKQHNAIEKIITTKDLSNCDEIILTNSVRNSVSVKLETH
ncbi:MAG: aminodeoxychorismate synthase component I [Cocleimonas sp.]